jgi:outer membrane lipoprotein-sorting protein
MVAVSILLVSGVATAQSADGESLSGEEIVERSLDTDSMGFQTGDAVMTLIVQDSSGSSRERRMRVRGIDADGQGRTLVRVIAPAEVAGQSYLFREREEGEDEVYVYLPALDTAPRRISGNQKNSAFMGSDFTYADLESRNLRDATYERLEDEQLAGFDVYVVEVTPTDPGERDDAKAKMWIRQSDFIPLRVRFFDEEGNTTRTMFTEELGQDGDQTYVRRMSLRPEDGGGTIMIIESVDFDAELDAGMFTPQELAN